MPAERVSMRKIRDVLRLTHAMGMSRRLVGDSTARGVISGGRCPQGFHRFHGRNVGATRMLSS